jgi:hypothetical protein
MAETGQIREARRGWGISSRPRLYGAIAVSVVGLVVLVTVLPTTVARYLITQQLDALGIEHAGIETVRVNVWQGKAAFGPVEFRTGPGDPGQLADGELSVSYLPLLGRRANAQSIRLIGLELHAVRGADGSVQVNGVPLTQLAPAMSSPGGEAPAGSPWGAGLETLALADSRLVLHEDDTRLLEFEIELLELSNFFTWTPQDPGQFSLTATLNGSTVLVEGEAAPFADRIRVAARTEVNGVTPDKVIRYTGPLGLERSDGEMLLRFEHEIAVTPDGEVDGHSDGTIELSQLAFAARDSKRLTVASSTVQADLDYAREVDGAVALGGTVVIEAGGVETQIDEAHALSLATVRTSLQGLDAEVRSDGSRRFTVVPEVDVEGMRFSGPISVSVDIVLELLTALQELAGAPVVDTGLEAYAGNAADLPDAVIELGRLHSEYPTFLFEGNSGRIGVDLVGRNEIERLAIESTDGTIDAATFGLEFDELGLGVGAGQGLTLRFSGDGWLGEGNSETAFGTALARRVDARLADLRFEASDGVLSLSTAATASAQGLSATLLPRDGLPQTRAAVEGVEFGLEKGALQAQPPRLTGELSASATVSGIDVAIGEAGEYGASRIASLALTGVEADASPRIAVEEMVVGGLDASLARKLVRSLLEGGEDTGRPDEAGGTPTADAATDDRQRLQQVQQALNERGYSAGVADGLMGPRTRGAIEDFQRDQNLEVDGAVGAELLEALAIGAAPAWALGETLPGPRVQLGRVALTEGARIHYSDELVQPAVDVETVVERLELRDVDTGDAARQATVDVAAVVNEFTHVSANGWIAGFTATSNLDLNATLAKLELPPFSPYAAEFGGVYVNRGQLSTQVDAVAEDGELGGTVGVQMLNVEFEPLSAEDEERLAETAGMPIRMAVNLLKDPQGQVELELPITGTVLSPNVDIGPAIRAAVGGVLRRVFPPTAIAGLMRRGKDEGIAFEPLPFAPGTPELLPQAREPAERVAALLQERPALSISVCGRVSSADVPALSGAATPEADAASAAPSQTGVDTDAGSETGTADEGTAVAAAPAEFADELLASLDDLATERTRAVRRLFLEALGIDAGRIGECRPVVDVNDPGPPRAEVSL